LNKNELYEYVRNLLVGNIGVPVNANMNTTARSKNQVVMNKIVWGYDAPTFDVSFNSRAVINIPITIVGNTQKDCDEIAQRVDNVFKGEMESIDLIDILETDMDSSLNENKYFLTNTTYVCLLK
jgi:hypothetical protein